MKSSEILTQALALIDTPEKWCRKWFARDTAGAACWFDSDRAVSFCAIGAYSRIYAKNPDADTTLASREDICLEYLYRANYHMPVADTNDDPKTTHADIVALYQRAIALAKEVE